MGSKERTPDHPVAIQNIISMSVFFLNIYYCRFGQFYNTRQKYNIISALVYYYYYYY